MIFSPYSLGVYTLDNRIVITSPCRMRSQLGVPTPMMTTYYARLVRREIMEAGRQAVTSK